MRTVSFAQYKARRLRVLSLLHFTSLQSLIVHFHLEAKRSRTKVKRREEKGREEKRRKAKGGEVKGIDIEREHYE